MSDDVVTCTVSDGIADVRLNRPDKLNAVNPAMFAGLGEVGDRVKADKSVRAVVLSGNGRGFCSGLDFGSFQAMAGAEDDSARVDRGGIPRGGQGDEGIVNGGQYASWVWREIPVPVIAAITGPALGAGFQIALACDIRFIAPDAKMSALEIRWGLTPDMTGTRTMVELLPLDVAKELVFTGRMVSGEEAVALGLATHLSANPHDDAMLLAQEIAAKNPYAVRGAKRLMNKASIDALAEHFANEAKTMGSLIGSPNNIEAVGAYFEKRDPKFADIE